jgi:hypothetical protein
MSLHSMWNAFANELRSCAVQRGYKLYHICYQLEYALGLYMSIHNRISKCARKSEIYRTKFLHCQFQIPVYIPIIWIPKILFISIIWYPSNSSCQSDFLAKIQRVLPFITKFYGEAIATPTSGGDSYTSQNWFLFCPPLCLYLKKKVLGLSWWVNPPPLWPSTYKSQKHCDLWKRFSTLCTVHLITVHQKKYIPTMLKIKLVFSQ